MACCCSCVNKRIPAVANTFTGTRGKSTLSRNWSLALSSMDFNEAPADVGSFANEDKAWTLLLFLLLISVMMGVLDADVVYSKTCALDEELPASMITIYLLLVAKSCELYITKRVAKT